ncbi:phage portal protein [Amycolatopsis kentuckyensis]|uniref:phage portal protein n=1 Tax=Amycolatopsis kentuckyensis TaxID=218823 RepID=UPI003565DFC7
MAFWSSWFRRGEQVEEAKAPAALARPAAPRRGYEYGVGPGGMTEANQGIGTATQTDRRSLMQQLYEAFLACPWSWACTNAIARTITAGGLVTDWVNDEGEGDQEKPEKPANVLALERLLDFCNPREDIRQLLRSTIADLLVFGDAFIEVVWLGRVPVALYTLDAPSVLPIADQHGEITAYVQVTDQGQRAEFAPHEVIHISLDAPRSGMFGVSPTEAALLPITTWLFTAATLKETYRKGNPPNIHADLPRDMAPAEVTKWTAQHMTRVVGPRNIGTPITTKGGGTIHELQQAKISEALDTLSQKRDEILACYGVPPAEVGVIESGNLGGGTGESQRKSYEVNTCDPIAAIVLEKLVSALVIGGFNITGWTLKFQQVDMRDSKVIEEIREKRVTTGLWTLNRARAEVGEPPVPGGDEPVFVVGTRMFLWRDVIAHGQAQIAAMLRGTSLEAGEPADEKTPVQLVHPEPEPVPDELKPFAGEPGEEQPDDVGAGGEEDQAGPGEPGKAGGKKDDAKKDDEPTELFGGDRARLAEFHSRYLARRDAALAEFAAA